MQNVKFLARLFLKLQENGPLLSARPRILFVLYQYCFFYLKGAKNFSS